MNLNALSKIVIGAAIDVHKELGPGHDEVSYEHALAQAFRSRRISFHIQKPLPVSYKGIRLDCGYRLDLLVAGGLVVEVKSVEAVLPVHEAQLLTYLRLGQWKLGLLINFNEELLKNGIRRRVLGLEEESTLPRPAHLQSSSPKCNAKAQRTQSDPSAGLTRDVIAAAIEVHKHLGPGLLLSAYRACLRHELHIRGFQFENDRPITLEFEGQKVPGNSGLDLVVNNSFVLKLLTVDKLLPVHQAQLVSQLRFSGFQNGLLINFNTYNLIEGIKRCIFTGSRTPVLTCKGE
jgi:GxxExxY protein